MQSPPIEWTAGITYLAFLDWYRDRGEPDGDTLSECIRDAFHVHTPRGRIAFTLTLAAGAAVLHRHICKET